VGVNLGNDAVLDEQFTDVSFAQIEKLAPFWDATNPDIGSFARDGGKLLLWAGEADYSIPTVSSLSYYQAVVKANGGLQNTQRFARYYLSSRRTTAAATRTWRRVTTPRSVWPSSNRRRGSGSSTRPRCGAAARAPTATKPTTTHRGARSTGTASEALS
jgi:hypothetical protein